MLGGMTMTKVQWCVAVVVLCGAVIVSGVWAAGQGNKDVPPAAGPDVGGRVDATAKAGQPAVGGRPLTFKRANLTADDLADMAGINVYRFQLAVAKKQSFRVTYREADSKEAQPRELAH
jgi:hypothetical protein